MIDCMRIYSRLAPVHADVQDNNMLRNKYILKNKGKYCLVILMDSHQVQAYIFFWTKVQAYMDKSQMYMMD